MEVLVYRTDIFGSSLHRLAICCPVLVLSFLCSAIWPGAVLVAWFHQAHQTLSDTINTPPVRSSNVERELDVSFTTAVHSADADTINKQTPERVYTINLVRCSHTYAPPISFLLAVIHFCTGVQRLHLNAVQRPVSATEPLPSCYICSTRYHSGSMHTVPVRITYYYFHTFILF